jgi:hypothetical protein
MVVLCAWPSTYPSLGFGTLYPGDGALTQSDPFLASDGRQDTDHCFFKNSG